MAVGGTMPPQQSKPELIQGNKKQIINGNNGTYTTLEYNHQSWLKYSWNIYKFVCKLFKEQYDKSLT